VIRLLRIAGALVVVGWGFFALYETIEAPASQLFGTTLVHGRGHVVALTFDDGPTARVTPGVLRILERERVHATFFVVGRAAAAQPALLRRMLRDGDEIGNHTLTHPHLNALLTAAALGIEIDRTQAAIRRATGRDARWLRPPFGARDYAAIDAAHRRGLGVAMWSAMLGDDAPAGDPAALARTLVAHVDDGALVVLHDGDQGRGDTGGRVYEASALCDVIATLRARGYRFVTVSELAASAHA
jgi:peptidoglycan/xylan/chitin deacetylase (PgdA/CDA1 family)